ncbi:MAG: CNT family concentrative nucleoside transporter [Flavobacteriales bacterium]|jgi:CNT family concentrative nucleoside transporter
MSTKTRRLALRCAGVGFALAFIFLTAVGYAQGDGSGEAAAAVATATTDLGAIGATGATMVDRAMSFVGIFALLGIATAFSTKRSAIDWRLVAVGTSIQIIFAIIILKTGPGQDFFAMAGDGFTRVINFTNAGVDTVFGSFMNNGQMMPAMETFAFRILPTIIFFSSLMAVLYYVGLMQLLVNGLAWVMQKTMRTSGSETLSAAGNIFVGQTEAPLLVKPFIERMTQSEIMAVMTGGFATVAGGVMGAYIGFLSQYFDNIAGHLLAASVMSAPAALVIAKIMVPETEESETRGTVRVEVKLDDVNVIDAAARGAAEGLMLALNVGAMLLAFIALVAMVNFIIGIPSYLQHGAALNTLLEWVSTAGVTIDSALLERCSSATLAWDARLGCIQEIQLAAPSVEQVSPWLTMSLDWIFGWVFAPIAWIMGVPWVDCVAVGQLFGQKMAINEFVAYLSLSQLMSDPATALQPRSALIATYALCGFANVGSIGIQIGGISGIAPSRRGDLARLGFRAMIGGTLAAFLTATIAGMLL